MNVIVEIIIITKLYFLSTVIETNFYYFPDFFVIFRRFLGR